MLLIKAQLLHRRCRPILQQLSPLMHVHLRKQCFHHRPRRIIIMIPLTMTTIKMVMSLITMIV